MQLQRPALLLHKGHLYVAFGSHQDTKPYHGWIFRFDPASLARTAIWCSTPNGKRGGIWQAGSGLTGGDDGTLYVMTGNGTTDPTKSNFGTAFVQLGLDLDVRSFFVPPNAAKLNKDDVDLGSAGPILLPGTNIVIGAGKEGVMHVLDRNGMGMRQLFQAAHAVDPVNIIGSGYHHVHGSPVVWRSDALGLRVYLWAERDKLRAFQWHDDTAVFDTSPVQMSTIESPGGSMPGGILSISANGGKAGSGLLWASIPKSDDALHAVVPGILRVFDAADLTHELWNSELNPTQDSSGLFAKYTPPTVADGRVFLATFSERVDVYGLRQWATFESQIQPPARMSPGQTFTMDVTFRNTGSTTWNPQAGYALGSESPKDNVTWGTNRHALPHAVAPGEEIKIPVTLTAPRQAGGGPVQWRLVQDGVEWFGEASQSMLAIVVLPPMNINVQQGIEVPNRTGFVIVTASDASNGAPLSGGTVTINGKSGGLGARIVFPLCFETMDTPGRPTRVQVPCEGSVDVAGFEPDSFVAPTR